MPTEYVIHWKSKLTGATGHGTTRLSKDTAEQKVAELNQKYSDIPWHWIEPAEEESADAPHP